MSDLTVITVDGPSGSGKGTVCRRLAADFGYHLLDSGALYRVTALAAQQQNIELDDEPAVAKIAANLAVKFTVDSTGNEKILLNNECITLMVRTESCGAQASQVAALPAVRAALLQRQRDFALAPGLIADGRDMGTVIFPNAQAKIYLTASAEQRAQRRVSQLNQLGVNVIFSNILRDIELRDQRDTSREHSPLRPANDALILDTSQLGIDEVMHAVHAHLQTLQLQPEV